MTPESSTSAVLLGPRADDDMIELAKLVEDIAYRWTDKRHGKGRESAKFDQALWRTLQDSGLTALTSTPGLAGPAELAVVLHGLARYAAPVPVAETDLLAGWLASKAGLESPAGPLTVAVAEAEVVDHRISGLAHDVPWGSEVSSIAIAISGRHGARLAIVASEELHIRQRSNLAGESRDRITFEIDADRFVPIEPSLLDELRVRGAWARCVQTVGAMDRAAQLTMRHAHERVQFGRALTKFQAVQHEIARMAGEIERCRASVALATAAVTDYGFGSTQALFAVSVAKVALAQSVRIVNTVAHQLHGAIGVTIEHDLWRSTLRAQSWVRDYGGPQHYARVLGSMVLTSGTPWNLLATGDAYHR